MFSDIYGDCKICSFVGIKWVLYTIYTVFVFMAAIYSIAAMTAAFFSLKALSAVNLSIFSIFIMLGGMALPFLCGVVFFGEALTGEKLICFAMMAAAMILTYEKGDSTLKGIFLCMGVFIANGAFGVISKIHQSSQLPAADSRSFLMLCSIITVPVCCAWYIAKFRRLCRPSKRETGALALYTQGAMLSEIYCVLRRSEAYLRLCSIRLYRVGVWCFRR